MSINSKKIGNAIKTMRKKSGYTQKQVAEKLNLGFSTINGYESGRIRLHSDLAIKLAKLYKCSLNELFEINEQPSKECKKVFLERFSPLFFAGFFGKNTYTIYNSIMSDPVIMSELKLNEVFERHSPLTKITENLTQKQKHHFLVESLKYINSLINIDNNIAEEETLFRSYIENHLPYPLSQEEKDSIQRALQKEYFGKNVDIYFTTPAIKRFLIWNLVWIANADCYYTPREAKYIEKVAIHLGLRQKDFKYIEKNFLKH